MRISAALQIRSQDLSARQVKDIIGYEATHLVVQGIHKVPPRSVPKANAWTGEFVALNAQDTDEAVRQCLNQYPQIADRVRTLRQLSPDIECTFYLALRPFSRDFVLFLEQDTIRRLSALQCDLSIEYFEDESREQPSSEYGGGKVPKQIPDFIIKDIHTELEWLGSEMWQSLHVEAQRDGSEIAVIADIQADTSTLTQRQICRLIRNACERRIPYKRSGYSWMGILTVNGNVIDSGIIGGCIGKDDHDPTAGS